MSSKKNYFSSKPKQITQAAINVSGRVFGNLKNVSIVTINNSDIAQAIFNNFEKKKIKKSWKIPHKMCNQNFYIFLLGIL